MIKGVKKYLWHKHIFRLIGLGLFAVVLWRIDFSQLWKIVRGLQALPLSAAVLLLFPYIGLKAARWYSILRIQGIVYNPTEVIKVYLSSMFMGIITPGRIGDFAKVYYLNSDCSVPIGRGFSSVFVDRMLDFGFLLLTGIVGGLVFSIRGDILQMLLLVFTLVLLGTGVFILGEPIKWLSSLLPRYIRDRGGYTLNEFSNGFRDVLTARFLKTVLISAGVFIIFYVQCFILARGLNIDIEFFKLSIYIAIMSIITLVPISISGIGTRDIALIYFFSIEGLPQETAVAYSFIYLMLFSVFTALLGLIGWYMKPMVKVDKEEGTVSLTSSS